MTFGLVLALTTTCQQDIRRLLPRRLASPRMSPLVLYILLWLGRSALGSGIAEPGSDGGVRLDALLDALTKAPIALINSNGFIGASLGMIIFTAAIRTFEHLFHAAEVDGAGTLAKIRFITLPALADQLRDDLQTLSPGELRVHPSPHQGRPVLRHDRLRLYVYRRAFESGQYGYGAALALFLIVIGVAVALLGWRFFDMERLLQRPRIEVQ